LEGEEKPSAKPKRGRKKKGTLEEPAVSIETKAEIKEALPPKAAEAVQPKIALKEGGKIVEAKKELKNKKRKKSPSKGRGEATGKRRVAGEREIGARQEKGFYKEEKEDRGKDAGRGGGRREKAEGKEAGVSFRPFRPMKKKVVLKTPKRQR